MSNSENTNDAIRVKDLSWEQESGWGIGPSYKAVGGNIGYRIYDHLTEDAKRYKVTTLGINSNTDTLGFTKTLAEAKALAQSDFRNRILPWVDSISHDDTDVEEEFEQEDPEITWRDLALQFDGQRILALQLLRSMVAEPGKWQDEAAEFVKAPPLSGEKVLAERIAALFQMTTERK